MKLPMLVLLCAAWMAAVAAPARGRVPAQAADLAATEALLLQQANALRTAQGRTPLRPDPRLQAAARGFAAHMALHDRYGHDADGRSAADRVAQAAFPHCMVAENIAFQYSSADFGTADLAQRFMQGWAASPGHRANLLDPVATATGVGVARSARSGRYYGVQLFARAWSDGVRFQVANRTHHATRYRVDDREEPLAPLSTATHEDCVPPRLQLLDEGEAPAVVPADGDRFELRPDGAGRWTLQRVPGALRR